MKKCINMPLINLAVLEEASFDIAVIEEVSKCDC